MQSISRILVPVDFSDRVLAMLPYVKLLASRYDAEIALLHVLNPFYAIPAMGMSGPVMFPVPESIFQNMSEQLEKFPVTELQGAKVKRFVYKGDPVSQIVAFAQAEGVQLIAIPTHGHGVLRRFLIGSDTAKILHDASCPVLTGVHMEEPSSPKTAKLSSVLCALDLMPRSQEILAYASQLASDCHARLGIVHVITPPNPGALLLLSPEFTMEIDKMARQDIERLQGAVRAVVEGVYIEEGQVGRTVSSVATSIGADLLVIGRRPQDGSPGNLTTNAYTIIRESPCPVISV